LVVGVAAHEVVDRRQPAHLVGDPPGGDAYDVVVLA
jgi:hypothetical protein